MTERLSSLKLRRKIQGIRRATNNGLAASSHRHLVRGVHGETKRLDGTNLAVTQNGVSTGLVCFGESAVCQQRSSHIRANNNPTVKGRGRVLVQLLGELTQHIPRGHLALSGAVEVSAVKHSLVTQLGLRTILKDTSSVGIDLCSHGVSVLAGGLVLEVTSGLSIVNILDEECVVLLLVHDQLGGLGRQGVVGECLTLGVGASLYSAKAVNLDRLAGVLQYRLEAGICHTSL